MATNTLLEERGARVGLAITAGFRGIYETMEQVRPYGPAISDLGFEKPPLLARPERTAEIRERVGPRGEVREPLDEASIAAAIALFEAEQVEAVAICFLFSFMNPAHEERVRAALAAAHPEWWLSVSSALLPQIREYYRLSTTVVNAYVAPVLGRYLHQLEAALDRQDVAPGRRYLMQSNGGSAPFAATIERAAGTILSGPAGGVTAGVGLAAVAGYRDLVTFDMGGTSCDVALIVGGQPGVTTLSAIGGRHVAVPMLDIHTVSAGGGTLARVMELGALRQLRVGPDSAGASPGPVSYRQGGTEPTVTDADLVLGYLNPERFAGGLRLDRAAAEAAIRERIAAPLGLDVPRAAAGIVQVIDVKMQEAVKAISTRRGHDLRAFTLVAFGGAGPVHAARVARELGLARVLVPPYPGCTSALGLLLADVRRDYVRSRLDPLERLDGEEAHALFAALEAEARADLEREGFAPAAIRLERYLDLRYAGQGYDVTVPAPHGPLTPETLAATRGVFDRLHEQQFGHAAPGEPVEIMSYRVVGRGLVPRLELPRRAPAATGAAAAPMGARVAYFPELGRAVACALYDRERLEPSAVLRGPCIVEQLDSTTLVLPGQVARVDDYGNLILTDVDA